MATVTVTESNNRINAAETTTGWSKIGSSLAQEPDFKYQGTYAVSSKIGTSLGGHYYTSTSTNMTTGDNQVWIAKGLWSNKDVLTSVPAACHRVGSGTGAYYEYYIADDGTQGDIDYPTKGGWLISPIDPNVAAWRDATSGSPSLSAVVYFATVGNFTAASKSENVVTDAIDLGDGLYLYGGDSTDPDGTFQDFVDDDEGEPTNGRFGHVSTVEGVLFVYGKLYIGRDTTPTATATEFTDSLKTITFPGGRVDAGWNELFCDLGSASTVVDIDSCVFNGPDRWDSRIKYFDTEFEIDGTNDEIDITAHGFETGDYIVYSREGGTEATGPTDAGNYWVRSVTANAISLHTTRQGAYTDASQQTLTASTTGNAENHSIKRTPSTRPDITFSGTSGTATLSGCSLVNCRDITCTSAVTITGCNIVAAEAITLSTADLTNCTVVNACIGLGEAIITTATVANISGCTFTAGDCGHAIELTSAAGSPYTYSNNSHSGYGPAEQSFGTTTGVDGTNDEIDIASHPYSDGDPIYYSDEGGAVSIGLTDQTLYFVRSVTAGSISLHPTAYGAINNQNKIPLTSTGSETHKLYSANAAIYNSSGSALTISLSGGTTPSIRNSAGSSTTLTTDPVTTQITVKNIDDNSNIQNARVFLAASDGTGDLPYQETVTITRSGTTATVTHTGHGMSTNDFALISGATDYLYNGCYQITVSDADTYTYTMNGTPAADASGTITSTGGYFNTLTNASGIVSDSRSKSNDQPLTGYVSKASAADDPKFARFTLNVTSTSSGGLTQTVFLSPDS